MILIESRENILQITFHGLLDVVDFFHHENKQLDTKCINFELILNLSISETPNLQVLIF